MNTIPADIEKLVANADDDKAITEAQQVQSPEDAESEAREAEAKRIQALDEIGAVLERQKDEAVTWRSEFELDWQLDYDQYSMASNQPLEAKQQRGGASQAEGEEYRSTQDNITRPKVIITASRLGDMLFPTNDANWTLEASPRPNVPDDKIPPKPQPEQTAPQPGPNGEPPVEQAPPPPAEYTADELLQAKKEYAARAADNMRMTIKDQLEECQYAEEGRAAIFDGVLYGTGVIAGPVQRMKRKHTFEGGGWNGAMIERGNPVAEHVDLWSFYPQPSRSMDECEHVFRLHLLPRRALRKLAKQPGFDASQIQRLLECEKPMHGALATVAINRGSLRPDSHIVLNDRFSVWQFRGPMPKAAFSAFMDGLVAQGDVTKEESEILLGELMRDNLSEIDCEVWCSQGIVIKMALSTLEPGELGYYVFNYEKNPSSIFGYGVPYLCRDDQKAVTQIWHALMLNTMMSAGPQIGVRAGHLVSTSSEHGGSGRSNSFNATRPRVWALGDEIKDIREALSVFIIPNVTDKMLGMYDRAKANADEHTMTPMIAQGEPTSAVPTSSGMAMLMNAANVVMRRLAKEWDGAITVPLITSYYDWNMAYNKDESIKGDYTIIPKGASHLLIKDIQAQHVQFATTLFSSNPVLAPYMKAGPFARKNIEMLDISPSELLYTDDEVKQNTAAQAEAPNPELMKAQAQAAHAQAQADKVASEAKLQSDRLEFEKYDRELDHKERMADTDARMRIQEMQLQGQQLALAQRLSLMESNERVAIQKIIADLQKHGANIDFQQYAKDTDARLKAEEIAQGDAKLQTEVAVEGKDARIQ